MICLIPDSRKLYNIYPKFYKYQLPVIHTFTSVMKRFTIFLLLLLYATVSSGFTVHLHYCMGELVESNLTHSDEPTCGGCGMEKEASSSDGCCKDEHKQIKVDQDKKLAEIAAKAKQTLSEQTVLFAFIAAENRLFDTVHQLPFSNAPPRQVIVPHYLFQRNFRI